MKAVAESTEYDQLAAIMTWANPLLPPAWSPPVAARPALWLFSWESPGRVSLAPELSWWDALTCDAVVFALLNPDRPVYRLTVRDRLWCYLAAESAARWDIPDDRLDSTEWLRQQRFSSIPSAKAVTRSRRSVDAAHDPEETN